MSPCRWIVSRVAVKKLADARDKQLLPAVSISHVQQFLPMTMTAMTA
jgi:hypothetical protein